MIRYTTYDNLSEQASRRKYAYTIQSLPKGVSIKVIYPFSSAFARVIFYYEDRYISTFLDTLGNLGAWPTPYFELFPNKEGDTTRFLYEDEDKFYQEVFSLLKGGYGVKSET
jgi:hypothetical protein